jgi:hypothetical protein
MARNATTFGPGNQAARQKGNRIAKVTRAEVEAMKWTDPETGEALNGWQALRKRAWTLAMHGEPKDSIRYIEFLFNRGYGQAKQEIEITEGSSEPEIDWSAIPVERRKEILGTLAELEKYAVAPGSESEPESDGPVEH